MELDVGRTLLLFMTVGFAAQIIDGALGMAYWLISTSALLAMGVGAPGCRCCACSEVRREASAPVLP